MPGLSEAFRILRLLFLQLKDESSCYFTFCSCLDQISCGLSELLNQISRHTCHLEEAGRVSLQLLGPLNTEQEPLPGLSVQQLTVSISLRSDPHRSLELLHNTKGEVSATWQTLMAGTATPSRLWLGTQPNTACHRLNPFWWTQILSCIGWFIRLI